jgi:predicted Ser/Thr protein kinase
MKIGVTYAKKVQYAGSVELSDGDLMAEFQYALRDLSDMDVSGTELTVTVAIDIEDMVTQQIENGYVLDEELVDEGEIDDLDIGSVE